MEIYDDVEEWGEQSDGVLAQIEQLEAQNEKLQAQNKTLESRVKQLENKLGYKQLLYYLDDRLTEISRYCWTIVRCACEEVRQITWRSQREIHKRVT